ncbi:hypothetical protein H632_c1547p1, partial [Helicosporidium sp. ATCC 50920]
MQLIQTFDYQELTRSNPYDDVALLLGASAELALECFSPLRDKAEWSLFVAIPDAQWVGMWYYPININLGVWPVSMGDTLRCDMWECDGGVGGCAPTAPYMRPNMTAGDDYLGSVDVKMANYHDDLTVVFKFTNASVETGAMML